MSYVANNIFEEKKKAKEKGTPIESSTVGYQKNRQVFNDELEGILTNVNIATSSTSKEKLGIDDVLSLTSSKEYCDSDQESIESSVSQMSKLNQLTMDSCVNNIKAFGVNGKKYGQLNNAIMLMICKDTLPLSTVEKEGFQYLMKIAVPLYKLPSRQTITQMIDDTYDFLSLQFREKLLDVESICMTTDIWTDTHKELHGVNWTFYL
ncbi:unnamed protein product [Parnassius apollo]|uniref:(apollo) hypothetical protein n=1 Tax=Parnassius apollo TaxID=110799 RepID=A0A8S3XVX1_PARAO|nr:unnamed protein product [Parnassius apollo]